MEIPYQEIHPDTLTSLIEQFILSEGTDYGEVELSLEQKVDNVKRLLKNNEAIISYCDETETVTILPKR